MLRAMHITRLPSSLALAAGLCLWSALPAVAESFASSASSAGSASVGSLSDSIGGSSDSSAGNGRVAAGGYRVVAAAMAADGRQRLQMQGVADGGAAFELLLPTAAAVLAVGDLVDVQARPYGLAFARATAAEPFFVALADDWRSELDLRPVAL